MLKLHTQSLFLNPFPGREKEENHKSTWNKKRNRRKITSKQSKDIIRKRLNGQWDIPQVKRRVRTQKVGLAMQKLAHIISLKVEATRLIRTRISF